jgi:hypothetical protein
MRRISGYASVRREQIKTLPTFILNDNVPGTPRSLAASRACESRMTAIASPISIHCAEINIEKFVKS